MDYDVKLLAAAKIVLNDLGRQILVNQHPQNIVAEARRKNRTQLDELLCKFAMILGFAESCL